MRSGPRRQRLDLLHFVRRAEAVEEMHEWNPRAQRGGLGNQGKIVGFLHAAEASMPQPSCGRPSRRCDRENRERMGGHARAVTWNTAGRSSPAILNMLGIISSSPGRGEGGGQRPVWSAPWTLPTAPPSLCSSTMDGMVPRGFPAFGRPLVAELGHGGDG